MKLNVILRCALITAAVLCMLPAHAGRSCEEKKPSLDTVVRGFRLAERTMRALDDSGHKVVLLARAGQDLSRYGLVYSHLGFAYRQPDGNGGHVWRVLHKLNHCGTADSAIYRQGLAEFFLDDLWRFETAWVAPAATVQDKLHALLLDDPRALALHHKPYSIVSYAWGRKYQQSNQWAAETLAAAMSGAATRQRAQAWLQWQDFQPAVLKIGALTRLGGRIGSANVAFDDHPDAQRFADRIETVTVESVFGWLERSGLGGPPQRLLLD